MIRSLAQFVPLDDEDREEARACSARMMADVGDKRDRFGTPRQESHYLGALGEIVASRFLGVAWECHPGDIGGRPDICAGGVCYEVRSVSPDAKYVELKAKPNDPPDRRLMLVVLYADGINVGGGIVAGWITAAEARKKGKKADPGRRGVPAWFVPAWSLQQDGWS